LGEPESDLSRELLERVFTWGRVLLSSLTSQETGVPGHSRAEIRRALRELVDGGRLRFADEGGSAWVEMGPLAPIRVGRCLVLVPAGREKEGVDPGDVPVSLLPGPAFGCGRHPTTRIALVLLEKALMPGGFLKPDLRDEALDAGCGTGVLGIAAVRLGMTRALLVDNDPAAVDEAWKNAAANRVVPRVRVTDKSLESLTQSFSLILANLRGPTLHGLLPWLAGTLVPEGVLIVSGMRPDETDRFIAAAAGAGFEILETAAAAGWGGAALARTP